MTTNHPPPSLPPLLALCELNSARVITHYVRHLDPSQRHVRLSAEHHTIACATDGLELAQAHRAIHLRAGDVAIWWQPTDGEASIIPSGKSGGLIYQFHLADGIDRHLQRQSWPPPIISQVDDATSLLTALAQEWRRMDAWSEARARHLVCLLLMACVRAEARREQPGRLSLGQLQQLNDFLNTQLDRRPTAHDIGRAVGLNPAYLSRRIKATVGVSLKRYVLELRMRRISGQLCLSDQPLSEIARDYGYTDLGLLTRQFRSVFAVAPTTWRRRYRFAPIRSTAQD